MKCLCFGFAVLLAAWGGPAMAAGDPLSPPELSDYLRWGPLRIRPGFQMTNFGYDDNVFVDNDNKVGDYRITLVPKVKGLVLFGSRAFLEFDERLDYTVYAEQTTQNFLDQNGSARLTLPFQRMGFFIEGELNRVRARPVDQEDERPVRREQGIGAGVILKLGWKTEIELGPSFTDWSYSDDDGGNIQERLNRKVERWTLASRYQLAARSYLTLDLLTEEITFDTPIPLKDSQGRQGLLGLEFGEGGAITGTARVGWGFIDADDPSRADFDELVGDAELSFRADSRSRVIFGFERDSGFAVVGNSTYFLDTNASLRYVRFLNRFLGAEAGVSHGRLTFPGLANQGSTREDDIDEYEVGLRFRLAEDSLGRKTEYRLRVGRYRRDSTDPDRDRTRTTVTMDAVLGF